MYLEAMRARDQGEEYESALAHALGLSLDEVTAFRDVTAYNAALKSGNADTQEIQARQAVIRFHRLERRTEERQAMRTALKRAQDDRRRERIASRPQERYTREEIGERDGWECGHCLTLVPREANPRDPRAPQVDHITPIAKGGADTRDNVTISHRYCNADRWGLGRRCSPEQAAARLARAVLEYEARCTPDCRPE
ncbi:HNH endonuclease [Streptomyces sp. NPDC001492]